MRKLGSIAAVAGAVLVVALAAWTRQPAADPQGAATVRGKGVKNRPFNISQPTAMTSTRTFSAPEVMVPLECNVHGWMQAYLGVLPHPFYAVTGADGSFTIKGLPPGTYTIEAWHEKYGTQTATVTVAGTESKTQDFTFAAK